MRYTGAVFLPAAADHQVTPTALPFPHYLSPAFVIPRPLEEQQNSILSFHGGNVQRI